MSNNKNSENESPIQYDGVMNENSWGFGHLETGQAALWQSTGKELVEGDTSTYNTFKMDKIDKFYDDSVTVCYNLFYLIFLKIIVEKKIKSN